jgi:hypothetical protein
MSIAGVCKGTNVEGWVARVTRGYGIPRNMAISLANFPSHDVSL